MEIQPDFDLKAYNTFNVTARCSYFVAVTDIDELKQALQFARDKNLALLILGGGSNILFSTDYAGLVIHVNIRGIEIVQSAAAGGSVTLKVGSGENWHDFVSYCLQKHFYGMENLALIPGNVGAAPIQNIGAYAVEQKDCFQCLEAFDIEKGICVNMNCAQCRFAYRDSVFKNEFRDRFVILSVTFKLNTSASVNLQYASLGEQFKGCGEVTPEQVFAAVCSIRRKKLPDPAVLGNAGSFFKNPLVDVKTYQDILLRYPSIPSFDSDTRGPNGEPLVKLFAGWLIEQAGWKGKRLGRAGVYESQSLVLVNLDTATGQELLRLATTLIRTVEDVFRITLEFEVNVI